MSIRRSLPRASSPACSRPATCISATISAPWCSWVEMQKTHECIYCVVDMHAITVWQDPAELRHDPRGDGGLYRLRPRPKQDHPFNQSQVPEHAELAWVFNCVARLGWLNRMTQFKEKAGKDRENASVGLYAYPVLMAADILAYRATHVPVGEDQKQHLELARDIAQKFNNDFEDRRGGLRGRHLLPAARAGDHRSGHARHEPARRHQEDVEVGAFGPVAHQHDRRRRHHRQEDPEGQDRPEPLPPRKRSWRSARRPTISSASMRRSPAQTKAAVLTRVRRRAVLDLQEGAGRACGLAHRSRQRRDDAPPRRPRRDRPHPRRRRRARPRHRRADHGPR